MREQDNVEIVKQSFAAFQRGDIQTVLNLCTDDIEFRHPMSTAIWPWAGQHRGRAQLAALAAGFWGVEEFEQFEPREFIAQGDKVVALVFERVRIKATGRVVENDFVTVFTLREGKIVQLYFYEDMAPFIAAVRGQETI